MSDGERFPVSAEWARRAWIDDAGYRRLYERSIRDPEGSGPTRACDSTGFGRIPAFGT